MRRAVLFLVCLLPGWVGVASAAPLPGGRASTSRQEAAQRKETQDALNRATQLRAAGRTKGREWREATRSIEALSRDGQARATWWLLEDQAQEGDPLGRKQISARKKLWKTLLKNGEQDPWVAKGYAFSRFVQESPALGSRWSQDRLKDLSRKTEDSEVRSAARLSLAQVIAPLDQHDLEEDLEEADLGAARQILRDLQQEHGTGSEWGLAAERALWRMENLRVGMSAPQLRSFDVHGNEIQLSDGLGKVCVLHFFGFGSPNIRNLVERDRQLIKRHWDHRFWLIGVNEDLFRNRYLETLDRHNVDWDVAWEGERERSETSARQWRLEQRSTTIVLDARGTICAIDPDPARLERVIAELVESTHNEAENRKRAQPPGGGSSGEAGGGH